MAKYDSRPVGVFDSGLGGLCAVKELKKILPNEDIIYFGDTGRVPYGNRSREIILKYSKQDVRFLLSHDIKAIVVACGTISAMAMEELKEEFYDKKIIGVVEASCESAVIKAKESKRNKGNQNNGENILVLGTTATISADIYKNTICEIDSKVNVLNKACPLFVPLVENGYVGKHPIVRLVAEEYINEFKNEELGSVILGCTHYPMIKEIISDILPDTVLIDSGYEVAKKFKVLLEENNLENNAENKGKLSVFVSDEVHNFAKIASDFLGEDITKSITKTDIEKY